MVQISHGGGNEEKVRDILTAAQERFGTYGYSKTTMHEIADDLGISKASLYYYYPDKEQLFRAVFEKEQHEFISLLHTLVDNSTDIHKTLYEFIHLRMKNFRIFINLVRAGLDEYRGIRNIIRDLWVSYREKELKEIGRIFKKGMEKGLFNIDDVDEMALLFLDTVLGLAHVQFKGKDITRLEEEDYHKLITRLEHFTAIFIKGISACEN